MHEISLPFLLSLRDQDVLFNYSNLDSTHVIDFHYIVSFLYNLYSIALKFDRLDKNTDVSKKFFSLKDKNKMTQNLSILEESMKNYVSEIQKDADFHEESKERYASMVTSVKDFIKVIKFRFFKKYGFFTDSLSERLIKQEPIIMQSIETFLFLSHVEPEIIYSPISDEILAMLRAYFLSKIETVKDLIEYCQQSIDVKLIGKEKRPSPAHRATVDVSHIERRFETRRYYLVTSLFQQFMKTISQDKTKFQYLESRWGSSKWRSGEEIKSRKKPNIKNLAYFFKDLELTFTNIKDFLSENNMDMLRQLGNLYFGQQHGFTLQASDIQKIRRMRDELP